MKYFNFISEKPSGKGESWSILSTTNYQRQPQDYLDIFGDEAVIARDEDLKGYLYCLIPCSSGFLLKVDIIETQKVYISDLLTLDNACDLMKSLQSMSPKGIARVWQAKKWDKGITIMQNETKFTFRKDEL